MLTDTLAPHALRVHSANWRSTPSHFIQSWKKEKKEAGHAALAVGYNASRKRFLIGSSSYADLPSNGSACWRPRKIRLQSKIFRKLQNSNPVVTEKTFEYAPIAHFPAFTSSNAVALKLLNRQ